MEGGGAKMKGIHMKNTVACYSMCSIYVPIQQVPLLHCHTGATGVTEQELLDLVRVLHC